MQTKAKRESMKKTIKKITIACTVVIRQREWYKHGRWDDTLAPSPDPTSPLLPTCPLPHLSLPPPHMQHALQREEAVGVSGRCDG